MKPPPPAALAPPALGQRLLPWLVGGLLALTLVKFGNPGLFSELLVMPGNSLEWMFFTWPPVIGYWLLAAVAAVGFATADWRAVRWRWPLAWFGLWLAWQFLAATTTAEATLTAKVLPQFLAVAVCLALGYITLSGRVPATGLWAGLLVGLALVIASGWQQHFGGLEATRKHFFLYLYPEAKDIPPDLLKRMSSERIFATLFYPNTLAVALLLLVPGTLAFLWSCERRLTSGARSFLICVFTLGAAGCLVWSGSKGGWLIALGLGFLGALHLPLGRAWKGALIAVALLGGLGGFAVRYSGYFERGATSVGARFDYWRAALQTTSAHPLLGSGPGTFGPMYARIKPPDAEMARLVHNDYLQQASDSGVVGALAYTGFMAWALWRAYPRQRDWLRLGAWLGVVGWAVQSALEFNLYIPAVAWPAFVVLGWLLACREREPILATAKPSDTSSHAAA
jgi:hypothetical protein